MALAHPITCPNRKTRPPHELFTRQNFAPLPPTKLPPKHSQLHTTLSKTYNAISAQIAPCPHNLQNTTNKITPLSHRLSQIHSNLLACQCQWLSPTLAHPTLSPPPNNPATPLPQLLQISHLTYQSPQYLHTHPNQNLHTISHSA